MWHALNVGLRDESLYFFVLKSFKMQCNAMIYHLNFDELLAQSCELRASSTQYIEELMAYTKLGWFLLDSACPILEEVPLDLC